VGEDIPELGEGELCGGEGERGERKEHEEAHVGKRVAHGESEARQDRAGLARHRLKRGVVHGARREANGVRS